MYDIGKSLQSEELQRVKGRRKNRVNRDVEISTIRGRRNKLSTNL